METELSEMGLSWGEAQVITKGKTQWKRLIDELHVCDK